ncbi:UNVERIFIED_CONTAM: hypothetical protein Scaly_0588100 [Sesamum calycinum]|uniref:Reverse transcriptase/retrotransposon-derived protein RNase H-like domain-containing protein n=1 Tax=Sesamum calycinum TaxID=2727403 RepID=A0AAW2RS87_9LAMI
MQLGDVPLEAVATSLYCFAKEVVHPRGMISLPLTLGTAPLQKTCLLKFLVVDIPSAYYVILGRPTLNVFRAIISTYQLKIKFPISGGVGEAQAHTLQAYPVPSPEPDKETPATVQPVEELLTIELIPSDPGKVIKIGSKMIEDVGDQVVNYLMRNKDIFAWTPRDLGSRISNGPKECQRAFEELKAYLAKLPLLVKSILGDTLYLYISSMSQVVNSVLVREEDGDQIPIYYVSEVLNGAECRYPSIEKMALVLVITARKLRPYFLSYPIGVRTNTPLKQVLGKPEASG